MTMATPMAIDFDSKDAEYLAATFSLKGLRREIHRADIEASVARQFGEEEAGAYWQSYLSTCKAALELTKAATPKTKYRGTGFIDVPELKSRVDIVAIAERYTELRKSGRNFVGSCPIHNEKHPSFYVYTEDKSWHCFGACDTGGDVISLVMAVERVDFKQALTILAGGHH